MASAGGAPPSFVLGEMFRPERFIFFVAFRAFFSLFSHFFALG
jgi:hypothetical protein